MELPHISEIRKLPEEEQIEFYKSLTKEQLLQFKFNWRSHARPNQVLPESGWTEALMLAGRGFGKAIDVEEDIYTENKGMVKLKDVEVGDTVFDENGKPCKVVNTFEVPEPKNAYRFNFSDGSFIDSCEDHQWITISYKDKLENWADKPTSTSKNIFEQYLSGKDKQVIPVCKPLNIKPKKRVDNSYDMGTFLSSSDDYEIFISGFNDNYIYASKKNRISLIQGIMDRRGSVSQSKSCYFRSGSEFLTDIVKFVLSSLGEKPKLQFFPSEEIYEISWSPLNFNPFYLSEKSRKVKLKQNINVRARSRMISSIEPIEPKPMRCLTVSSENNMFLIGKSLIPTHNTRSGSEWVRECVEKYGCMRIGLVGATAADVRDVMWRGQALALDTDIPTPNGWVKMGDLKTGDYVFAGNGDITRIKAVSQIWSGRKCYKMSFSNSSQDIICDENHKWVTISRNQKRRFNARKRSGEIETSVLFAHEVYKNQDYKGYAALAIPINGMVKYEEKELPIPPYTMGAWLGDGTSKSSGFTQHVGDIEVIDRIKTDGFKVGKGNGKYDWWIYGLNPELRKLNLLKNKHIPDIYMQASVAQRLELLRGLMDTDGTVTNKGRCSIGMANRSLIEQIRELCISLGIKASRINSKPEREFISTNNKTYTSAVFYRFSFYTNTINPFCMKRKHNKVNEKEITMRNMFRNIQSVEPVDSVDTVCISVEHDSQTFLCGRDFLVTHNSGLEGVCPPWNMPEYQVTNRRIVWPNGATATFFTAEEPEHLRGPQHDAVWFDEPARCKKVDDMYDQIMFGLRLNSSKGHEPKLLMTTTPKPIPLIRSLIKKSEKPKETGVILVTGKTEENIENLAKSTVKRLREKYDGTRIGRQELDAEMLGDHEDALWTWETIDAAWGKFGEDFNIGEFTDNLSRIVVGVDPSGSRGAVGDSTGIVVCGVDSEGHYYVLEDASLQGSPETWAQKAISTTKAFGADKIIAEKNFGGTMVESVLRTAWSDAPVKIIHASRSKSARAEPISMLYEQGKVTHIKRFPELEQEMFDMTMSGYKGEGSPDRLDALVWAITELSQNKSMSFNFKVTGKHY